MSSPVDPRLVAAFGSETRLRILAVLASAHGPLTAYRVASVAEVPAPKAYRELRRLGESGLAVRRGNRWRTTDHPLVPFLRTHLRLAWSEDWKAARVGVDRIFDRLATLPHPSPPRGFAPRNPEEFRRSTYKDRRLRELGLATSVHGE